MSEHQRCKACGRVWPSYEPTRFLDVAWLVFVQLPCYWWHFKFVCPGKSAHAAQERT